MEEYPNDEKMGARSSFSSQIERAQRACWFVCLKFLPNPLGLKDRQRRGFTVRPGQKVTSPAFVELVAPQPKRLEECVIEFESSSGGKMRVQWKAAVPLDWVSLLRARRETEG